MDVEYLDYWLQDPLVDMRRVTRHLVPTTLTYCRPLVVSQYSNQLMDRLVPPDVHSYVNKVCDGPVTVGKHARPFKSYGLVSLFEIKLPDIPE